MPDRFQHIGDDQLVYGLPKHMAAVAKNTARAEDKPYWEYVPKPGACDKCQAMKGRLFAERPGPVHPNCQCEVRQTKRKLVDISDHLDGFGAHAFHRFDAGQSITVSIYNSGPFGAGVTIFVDGEARAETGLMYPSQLLTFPFSKFGEPPIPWEIRLVCLIGDNSMLLYRITG